MFHGPAVVLGGARDQVERTDSMIAHYRHTGRRTSVQYTVPVKGVLAGVVGLWAAVRGATFALGQVLEARPACLQQECDAVTQAVLWGYRFMAGN